MNTTLIHFNDIYNVEKSPRFVYQVKKARREATEASGRNNCLVIFSGDAFSPSIMSTMVRGEHIIPVLNSLSIDCACLGNHDLDFGVNEFRALAKECNFPWICSNARLCAVGGGAEDKPLSGCKEYAVIDKKEDGGPRVLVVGLIESEWMATLASIEPKDIEYEDYVDYVRRRVPELVEELGPFDFVVASSHMRMPQDYRLADECGGIIDIVLGGHDHHYEDTVRDNGVRVLNSGTDFEDFTIIQVEGREEQVVPQNNANPLKTTTTRVSVGRDSEEDPEVVDAIKDIEELVEKSMDVVVGRTKVALDARFAEIRTKETNISNTIARVMARATNADVAILNAGTIRADRIIGPGLLKSRDLCDMLPMADEMAVVELTAERLLKALENGVSKYPAMEGRFPCVDGVRFAFDPSKPPGSRVVQGSVYVRDRSSERYAIRRRAQRLEKEETGHYVEDSASRGFSPLDPDKTYTVVSKTYLLSGKDGYEEAFVGAPVVQDEELCPVLPTALRNVFTEISKLRRWAGLTHGGAAVIEAANKFKRPVRQSVVDPFAIAPEVDGRIVNVATTPLAP